MSEPKKPSLGLLVVKAPALPLGMSGQGAGVTTRRSSAAGAPPGTGLGSFSKMVSLDEEKKGGAAKRPRAAVPEPPAKLPPYKCPRLVPKPAAAAGAVPAAQGGPASGGGSGAAKETAAQSARPLPLLSPAPGRAPLESVTVTTAEARSLERVLGEAEAGRRDSPAEAAGGAEAAAPAVSPLRGAVLFASPPLPAAQAAPAQPPPELPLPEEADMDEAEAEDEREVWGDGSAELRQLDVAALIAQVTQKGHVCGPLGYNDDVDDMPLAQAAAAAAAAGPAHPPASMQGQPVTHSPQPVSSISLHAPPAALVASAPPASSAPTLPSDGGGGTAARAAAAAAAAPSVLLEHWGLPRAVVSVYRSRGVSSMYPWQAEALSVEGVADGRSLVYCAPTSGGKSLVADVLLLRCIVRTGRSALVVLPFVSLCEEKARSLTPLCAAVGRRVHRQFGQHGGRLPSGSLGVIVATFEKANAIVSRLVAADRFHEIGVVVLDELHMIADGDRGALVELLLTKTLYVARTSAQNLTQGTGAAPALLSQFARRSGALAAGASFDASVQLVGMSATLPNFGELAGWLGAAAFETHFRPVPLSYHIKVGNIIQNSEGVATRPPLPPMTDDPEHLAYLSQETLSGGGSVLVFCGTKKACEVEAKFLAAALAVPPCPPEPGEELGAREVAAEALRRAGGDASPLAALVDRGVAWHHSGLSGEERDAVESGYKAGGIRVICCTSTLAAGVNLPARRVLMRHDYRGLPTETLDAATYQQMAGRAGRAGLDSSGESILFSPPKVSPERLAQLRELVKAAPLRLNSVLANERTGPASLQRVLLEAVTSGLVVTVADMQRYMMCTLMSSLVPFSEVEAKTRVALRSLQEQRLIRFDDSVSPPVWQPMPWGKASAASTLPVALAAVLRADLERARLEGVVTATDLHVLFLISPTEEPPSWPSKLANILAPCLANGDETRARVVNRIGLDAGWVDRTSRGMPRPAAQLESGARLARWNENNRLAVRLYHALLLEQLVGEQPPTAVAASFSVDRGWLCALQERAGRMAGAVSLLAEGLEYEELAKLTNLMQDRVNAGARSDVMSLATLGCVSASVARTLYRAGYRTLEAIAALPGAAPLAEALLNASPRQGKAAERAERRRADRILEAAREAVAERAQLLREQADEAEALVRGGSAPGAGPASGQAAADPADLPPPPGAATAAGAAGEPSQRAATASGGTAGEYSQLSLRAAIDAAVAFVPPFPPPYPSPPPIPSSSELPLLATASAEEVAAAWGALEGTSGCVCCADAASWAALSRHWDGSDSFAFCAAWDRPGAGHPGGPLPRLRGLALAFDSPPSLRSAVFYVPFTKTDFGEQLRSACLARLAAPRAGVRRVSCDIKEQIQALCCRTRDPREVPLACLAALGETGAEDVRVMAWLLTPGDERLFGGNRQSRPETVLSALGINCASTIAASMVRQNSVPHAAAAQAAARGAAVAREASGHLRSCLAAKGLYQLLGDLETPLLPVLASMERVGMPFSPGVLTMQHKAVEARLGELRERVRSLAGQPKLDLASPKALSDCLFVAMRFAPPGKALGNGGGKGAKGGRPVQQFSVNKAALQELASSDPRAQPIVEALLAHRTLSQRLALSRNYMEHAVKLPSGRPGESRIHGTIYQTNTETGRMVMEDPSLQNVPHAVMFPFARSAPGAPLARLAPRAAFRPAPGRLLLVADFRQFELRMMAHFGDDSALREVLRGADPFTVLAALWTRKDESRITPPERAWAKTIAYGLLYGKGHASLAHEMGISAVEAVQLIETFKASLPGVNGWLTRVLEEARARGSEPHVLTVLGRRRDLPALLAAQESARSHAERQAVNTVCQGSAADVLKLALVHLQRHLAADGAHRARLVLSVHDDAVLEVESHALAWAAALMRRVMEEAGVRAGLTVPLAVQLRVGSNWDALTPI